MDALGYWALSPAFSVVQAAFLFCGADPSHVDAQTERNSSTHPNGYVAVRNSLIYAIESGRLKAHVRHESYGQGDFSDEIDIHTTRIERADLDEFFDRGGVQGSFFGRRFNKAAASGDVGQLPLKLNAALKAWAAVSSDPRLVHRKSPKQALKAWLVEHADELGLRKRDGNLNEAGIEEICKVANWRPEGGATPTPAALPDRSQPPPPQQHLPNPIGREPINYSGDLDAEIPF